MILEEQDRVYLNSIKAELQEILKISGVLYCFYAPSWNLQSESWEIRVTSVVDSTSGWNDPVTDALINVEGEFYTRHKEVYWSFRINHLRRLEDLGAILKSLQERGVAV